MDASRLIGLRESLGGVSLLAGPASAGILVAALEPVAVMWVTVSIAALAALLTLLLPPRATAPERDESPASVRTALGSVFRGVGIIAGSPLLRRFEAIDEHTPEAELEEIAAQVQEVLADAADELPPLREDWLRLARELVERDLNSRQREFLRSQE